MSAKYEATGILHEIYDAQQITEKFKKREFILEIQDGQYAEHVKFQLVQEKCSLLDGLQVGDTATVSFNLRGRGFNKNGQMLYFTNLEAWKVDAAGATQGAKSDFASANKNPALRQQPAPVADASDMLPF